MEVDITDLEDHDKVFGSVSHLPHIIARAYKESLDVEDIIQNSLLVVVKKLNVLEPPIRLYGMRYLVIMPRISKKG